MVDYKNLKIISRLSSGAMGKVYLVSDLSKQRKYVCKIVDLQGVTGCNRHLEIDILSILKSALVPNIVDYFLDKKNMKQYIFLEYIEGITLEKFINIHGNVTIHRALQWMIDLVKNINYIYDKNILHRDLTPANVILDNHHKLHIIDFGNAMFIGEQSNHVGTKAYCAPEFLACNQSDIRTEVYSLGKLIITLIGSDIYDKIRVSDDLNNNESLNLEAQFIKVLQRCISVSPKMRYQRFSDLLVVLEKLNRLNEVI